MPTIVLLSVLAGLLLQQPTPPPSGVDFEFFKTRVQPIFTTKRPGHARCISCHSIGTPMRLQPLTPGSGTWSDEDSRLNFEVVRQRIVPRNPDASRLLLHPLAEPAGGDPHHDGGKHWASRDDSEWQTLAAWVRGEGLTRSTSVTPGKVRIIQTNSAGDNVHVIDPATNRVVGEITGIEVNHGAAAAPDGRHLYISNEADSTLDVVDATSLRVTNKIPLSGHPNNIAAGRDGRRVYVAISQAPGAIDVIDTVSLRRVKTIEVKGAVHNTYVTPDGKFVVAGSIVGKNVTVIDAVTEQPVWTLNFDLGVRPMAFERNADGSTKRIFVQLTELNGFAIVDFATRMETGRIELPKIAAGKTPGPRRRQRFPWSGGDIRRDQAGRQQPAQQRDLLVFASRPEARRDGRCRPCAGLGHADTRQQDRLRGKCRIQFGVGRRTPNDAGSHSYSRRTGAQTEHHGGSAISIAAAAIGFVHRTWQKHIPTRGWKPSAMEYLQ